MRRVAFIGDGAYDSALGDLVFREADLVVWLDLPLRVTVPRLCRRTVRRIRPREELWNGNRETWSGAVDLLRWTIRTHCRRRREWPARLAAFHVVRLRTPAEVERFMREL